MSDEEKIAPQDASPSRRNFLIAGGTAIAAAGVAVAAKFTNAPGLLGLDRKTVPRITGGWVNESAALGHRLVARC